MSKHLEIVEIFYIEAQEMLLVDFSFKIRCNQLIRFL